jgi:hypothetical protein
MLADPRRGIKARASLHLGQPVQFVDFRDGKMRRGKIIAMRDTQATVLEEGTKRTWKISCLPMQGYTVAERRTEQAPYEAPPEPVIAATSAREFQRGDTDTFNDRDGRAITGVIVRINERTATIGTAICANPALQERELAKIAALSDSLGQALQRRGVPEIQSALAAQVGMVAFVHASVSMA